MAHAESPPKTTELWGAFFVTTRYAHFSPKITLLGAHWNRAPTEGNEVVMYSTTTASRDFALARPVEARRHEDTIDTYVWTDEYDFLRSLYDSADNTSPKFRFPDLISACVSLVFRDDDAADLIFDYLRSELVLRNPNTTRRREAMWKAQYNLLLDLSARERTSIPIRSFS